MKNAAAPIEEEEKKETEVDEAKKEKTSPLDQFELKPHLFKAYLKLIGFRLLSTVLDPAQHLSKPLYIYQKQ